METLNTAAVYTNRFEALVERLYHEQPALQGYEGTLESVIRTHFAQMSAQSHTWKRDTFRELLLLMHAKKCYAVLRNPAFIEVLANISAFGNKMIRPAHDWVKDSLTAEGQLASLIRHCFAQFEVPEFMEYVFAEGNKVHMHWYIQLGRGDSAQQLSAFPVRFTKTMAHEFRQTPKHFTVHQAIRRAQALGYGATMQTAEAIAWSATLEEIGNPTFRSAVIQFIAKAKEPIAFDTLQQVVEYLVEMYRQDPSFTLEGRTWTALARQAVEYHSELAKRLAAESYNGWEPCAINNFEIEKGMVIIKIVQLTNSEALYEEGHEMSHCVAEYDHDCADGTIAIFSLRKFTKGVEGYETLATLEVQLTTYEVVQAKARFNEMISTEAHKYITQWAAKEQMTIDYEFYTERPPAPIVPTPAAEAIRAQPQEYRPMNDADFERHHYQPARYSGGGLSGGEIAKIILIVLKVLWMLSRIK